MKIKDFKLAVNVPNQNGIPSRQLMDVGAMSQPLFSKLFSTTKDKTSPK